MEKTLLYTKKKEIGIAFLLQNIKNSWKAIN